MAIFIFFFNVGQVVETKEKQLFCFSISLTRSNKFDSVSNLGEQCFLFEVFLEKKYKDFLTANRWCLFVSNDKPAVTVTNKSDAEFFK